MYPDYETMRIKKMMAKNNQRNHVISVISGSDSVFKHWKYTLKDRYQTNELQLSSNYFVVLKKKLLTFLDSFIIYLMKHRECV